MSDLKPCPFCGSSSAVFVREDKPFLYSVQCLNDDCSCRTDNYKAYRFAIETWNSRVGDECLEEGEEE